MKTLNLWMVMMAEDGRNDLTLQIAAPTIEDSLVLAIYQEPKRRIIKVEQRGTVLIYVGQGV